jgi:hypothetical protein
MEALHNATLQQNNILLVANKILKEADPSN